MTDSITTGNWRRALAVVEQVLDLAGPEREAAVLEHCAGDAQLAGTVRLWLEAGDYAGTLPEWSAVLPSALIDLGAPLEPGARVGAWQVLRVAGVGGMGTVYEAVRADGTFDQRAALKVVRYAGDVGLLSRRLRGERTILARLEHSGIARLLDGGLTDNGLPWYAMEFVAGSSIDEHCDASRLTLRQRLELFRDVCDAVRYAHQQLVVHRDLKPSNILVADGKVKLLDFGIAALLEPSTPAEPAGGHPPTLARLFTPEYASPEQLRGDPATVAADIFSLGVVLHELLVGCRPITQGEGVASPSSLQILLPIAAARDTTPARLSRQLSGDLDTIVRTALQHDPARRYGSADALAEDIGNHLAGQPIRARPDTWAYRTGKFLRRHRVAAALALLAIVGMAVATASARRNAHRAEREAASAARSAAFVVGLLELSYPFDSGSSTPSLRAMLDSGTARSRELERGGITFPSSLLEALALGYYGLGRYDRAIELDSLALERRIATGEPDSSIAASRWALAEALRMSSRERDAVPEFRRVAAVIAAAEGPQSPAMARLLQGLARAYRSMGELDRSDSLLDRVEQILDAHPTQARIAYAHAHQTRGHLHLERRQLDLAEAEYRRAMDVRRQVGASPLEVANSNGDLAEVARLRGRLALADSFIDASVRIKRRQLGDGHPEVGDDLRERAAIALARGDLPAAERDYQAAQARYASAGWIPPWRHAPLLVGLARVRVANGEAATADSLLHLAVAQLAELETVPTRLHREAAGLRDSIAQLRP